MANDNKPKITVDDIVRYSSLQLARNKIKNGTKQDGAHFATGAFNSYLEDRLEGKSPEAREAALGVIGPIYGRMMQEAQKGALSATSEENFLAYYDNARAQVEVANIGTLLESVQKVGYVGEIPGYLRAHEGETYQELNQSAQKILAKYGDKFDPKTLEGKEKDTIISISALNLLLENMDSHAEARSKDWELSSQLVDSGKEKK